MKPRLLAPLMSGDVPDELIERCCIVMHDAYEAAAERHGWSTQARSRKPWADVPEANQATMREAVAVVLPVVRQQIAAEVEALEDGVEGDVAVGIRLAVRVVRGDP